MEPKCLIPFINVLVLDNDKKEDLTQNVLKVLKPFADSLLIFLIVVMMWGFILSKLELTSRLESLEKILIYGRFL